MRSVWIAGFVAVGLTLLIAAMPVSAQSIYGLSFRTTDAAPTGAPRGSVDIVAADGGYVVTVDLSNAKDELDLGSYGGAKDFVIWAVDMDGVSENIGTLDGNLLLEEAEFPRLIAKIYLTAEPSASVEEPSGQRLYETTLRSVTEVAPQASDAESAAMASTAAATAESPTEEAAAPTTAPEPTDASAAAKTGSDKPKELPTTGSDLGDLIVLLVVSLILIGAGLKLRTVRI